MSTPTLFSDKIQKEGGFCTSAWLYQGDLDWAHIGLKFLYHRPQKPILELLIAGMERGWKIGGLYLPDSMYEMETWHCDERHCLDFIAEWKFAQSILFHPSLVSTREELFEINPQWI